MLVKTICLDTFILQFIEPWITYQEIAKESCPVEGKQTLSTNKQQKAYSIDS